MTMAALSGSRYIEYLIRPMRDSADVTQSDLGTEEDLEMLLNTFSGYDLGIVDFAQIGATAERARTTSCLTSRSPGPAKPRDAKLPERLEAAVRGGADNFTTSGNYRKRHGGDRGTGQGDVVGRLLGSLEDLGKAAKISRSESSQQQTSAVIKQQQ